MQNSRLQRRIPKFLMSLVVLMFTIMFLTPSAGASSTTQTSDYYTIAVGDVRTYTTTAVDDAIVNLWLCEDLEKEQEIGDGLEILHKELNFTPGVYRSSPGTIKYTVKAIEPGIYVLPSPYIHIISYLNGAPSVERITYTSVQVTVKQFIWTLSDDGTLTIERGVFPNYGPFEWDDYRDSIKKVVLCDGITSIGNYAFYGYRNLTSVTIPSSVTSIGDSAFEGCSSLRSVTIPSSVTSIGDSAFEGCSSLTSITIPNSVTSIGEAAFQGCLGLFDDSGMLIIQNTVFDCKEDVISITIPGNVTSISESAFADCRNLTNITIPNSVTSIGSSAFENCRNLSSITIPDSVTRIGSRAFNGCSNLSSVVLPKNLTIIEDTVFHGCALTSITIPNSVTNIERAAFWACDFESIAIPSSVTSIDESAFTYCPLTQITVASGNPNFTVIDNMLFDKGKTTLLLYPANKSGDVTLPSSVTAIGGYAFSGCRLNSVSIPEGIISIGTSAFYGFNRLTSVTLPGTLTSIGSSAFIYQDSLTDVYFTGTESQWQNISVGSNNYALNNATVHFQSPSGLQGSCGENVTWCLSQGILTISGSGEMSNYSFGNSPWAGCSIQKVVIQRGVTSIGTYAFRGCTSLAEITIPDSVTDIGTYAFHSCTSLTEITIPKGVTSISRGAFYGCNRLKNVTIPASVSIIGDYAFDGCNALETVTYGGTDEQWRAITINSGNEQLLRIKSQSPVSWSISNGTLTISGNGDMEDYYYDQSTGVYTTPWYFQRSAITKIVVNKGITGIGHLAFVDLYNVTSVSLPTSLTSIGSSAFLNCSSMKQLQIPANVTSLGNFFLHMCSSLESLTVASDNSSFVSINNVLFTKNGDVLVACASAVMGSSYTIPDGVTRIASCAFCCAENLTKVTIPTSVTLINSYAFDECCNLTDVYYNGTYEDWDEDVLIFINGNDYLLNAQMHYGETGGYENLPTITLPAGTKTVASQAFAGSGAQVIIIPASCTSVAADAFEGCPNLQYIVNRSSVTITAPKGVKLIKE